jgi:hypothetical protein
MLNHQLSQKLKQIGIDKFNHLIYILIGINDYLVVAPTIYDMRFV